MSEKTEKPTAKKLRDAARKGQTFKSRDVIAVIVLAAGAASVGMVVDLRHVMLELAAVAQYGSAADPAAYVQYWGREFLKLALPFILICALAGVIPSLVQSRFTLATEALKLDFSNLNPVNGFKKMFSLRTVKEIAKALLYVVVTAVTVRLFITLNHRDLFGLFRASPDVLGHMWISLTVRLIFLFLVCALPILVLDVGLEFFLYYKNLKMDKHEVKQEYKETEGNPEIKSKRKEVHIELLSEETKAAVEQSTFVLANPTHIAIGIYVNADVTPLPFISVRETNARALAVIKYAEMKGVPVVRNIALARAIYAKCRRRFTFIDPDNLLAVLRIIEWLRQVEAANRGVDLQEEPHAQPSAKTGDAGGPITGEDADEHNEQGHQEPGRRA